MTAENSSFRVTWMPNCNAGIIALGQGVALTLRQRLREVVLEADAKLKESAREWGDPHSDLKGMRVTLYAKHYVQDGLVIRYAVHAVKDEVFVQLVEPIRGGPFDV